MTNAESLTATLEALPLGEPWASAAASAEHARAALAALAEAQVFPDVLSPKSADEIAYYGQLIERPSPARFGDEMSEFHRRSLTAHSDLAALFRSREALEDVASAAARHAAPATNLETFEAAATRAANGARKKYMLAIAAQLAALEQGHELAPAARDLLAADDLARRIAAAKSRHEEHARAELARAEMERRAAARAVRDKTVERVREAERQAADAAAQAALSASAYRLTRADALCERLRESGLKQIHVGDDELYDIAYLVSTARGMSLESLARYEAAVAAHERA